MRVCGRAGGNHYQPASPSSRTSSPSSPVLARRLLLNPRGWRHRSASPWLQLQAAVNHGGRPGSGVYLRQQVGDQRRAITVMRDRLPDGREAGHSAPTAWQENNLPKWSLPICFPYKFIPAVFMSHYYVNTWIYRMLSAVSIFPHPIKAIAFFVSGGHCDPKEFGSRPNAKP